MTEIVPNVLPGVVRKLVTIRPITNIEIRPLTTPRGAEVVTVHGGWKVIVPQEMYEVGQNILFFEIDSFIPASLANFAWDSDVHMEEFNGESGYHVRSHIFRTQLSQGLILHISEFAEVQEAVDELLKEHGDTEGWQIVHGMAFEHMIGVKKWEESEDNLGAMIGPAPTFIPWAGCVRAQSAPEIFSHMDCTYQVTEKIDGHSMTVYRVQHGSVYDQALPELPEGSAQRNGHARIGVNTRSRDLDERGNSIYWEAAKDLGLPSKLSMLRLPNLAIQGELISPSMRDSSLQFAPGERPKFIIFQIFDIDARVYLDPARVHRICNRMVLPHVPVIGHFKLKDFASNIDELVAKADGTGFQGQEREGLVFKVLKGPGGPNFKVISNEWLLKNT